MEQNLENKILSALQGIIDTGKNIKDSRQYNPDFENYLKYVKSVKDFIQQHTVETFLLNSIDKLPINKLKPGPLSFLGFPFGSMSYKIVDKTIDEIIFITEKMINYIQYPDLRGELFSA